jgi:hypothetical protein
MESEMKAANRRRFIGALAASGAALATHSHAAPDKLGFNAVKKDTDFACLYHCDFSDHARFSQMLNNINNHLSAYDFDPMKIKIVIVAHAAGLKFFLEELSGTPWERRPSIPISTSASPAWRNTALKAISARLPTSG